MYLCFCVCMLLMSLCLYYVTLCASIVRILLAFVNIFTIYVCSFYVFCVWVGVCAIIDHVCQYIFHKFVFDDLWIQRSQDSQKQFDLWNHSRYHFRIFWGNTLIDFQQDCKDNLWPHTQLTGGLKSKILVSKYSARKKRGLIFLAFMVWILVKSKWG